MGSPVINRGGSMRFLTERGEAAARDAIEREIGAWIACRSWGLRWAVRERTNPWVVGCWGWRRRLWRAQSSQHHPSQRTNCHILLILRWPEKNRSVIYVLFLYWVSLLGFFFIWPEPELNQRYIKLYVCQIICIWFNLFRILYINFIVLKQSNYQILWELYFVKIFNTK